MAFEKRGAGEGSSWRAAADQPWRALLFSTHRQKTTDRMNKRKADVALKSIAVDTSNRQNARVISSHIDEIEHLCTRWNSDHWIGDSRLRGVRGLLTAIDSRGYERSPHQVQFHESFLKACSRIFFREDWAVHRTTIMKHHEWPTTPSEILISTPRRFGKTFRCVDTFASHSSHTLPRPPSPPSSPMFTCVLLVYSVAMFCVCIALVFRVEVVVFSPGQRASQSMLTRMKEFISTLGLDDKIVMSNSETLRVTSFQGGTGLVRSLPSAVAVRAIRIVFLCI
jgi:hypothetical protein